MKKKEELGLPWWFKKGAFHGGSDGKESACNAGDPGSIPMSFVPSTFLSCRLWRSHRLGWQWRRRICIFQCLQDIPGQWNLLCYALTPISSPFLVTTLGLQGFPGGSDGKESACDTGDPGLIPGLGRSPGEGKVHSLQYSGLENSMDRGAWWAKVHPVTKSWTQLSD